MRTEKGTGPDLLFQPSLEVDEIEAEAISEDLTDLSDLLKDILDTTR